MNNLNDQKLAAPLAALIATLIAAAPGPAQAQRRVEFGYKDRIFDEKYVYEPQSNPLALMTVIAAAQIRLTPGADGRPSLPSPRLLEAMGGACGSLLIPTAGNEDALTPSQKALQAQAQQAQAQQARTQDAPQSQQTAPGPETIELGPNDECVIQMLLFETAFADPLSTDAQLSRLSRQMRQRFGQVWITPDEARDPALREGAARQRALSQRVTRLRAAGIDLPPELEELRTQGKVQGFAAAARRLAAAEPYATLDRQLTALEETAARSWLEPEARRVAAQAAEEQRQKAEAEQEDRRRMEAEEQRARQRLEEKQRRDAERLQKEEERRRKMIESGRQDQVRDIRRRLGDVNRALEQATVMARVTRHPIPTVPDLRTDIGRLLGRRAKLEAELRQLEQSAPIADVAQPAAPPLPSTIPPSSLCRMGQRCPVIEVTVFCRTPRQLQAVLSQRPGPDRKQVLTVFTASGDCRLLRPGDIALWTAPITVITPQGEAPAELVPATLADNTTGFVLRDGLLPAAEAAR